MGMVDGIDGVVYFTSNDGSIYAVRGGTKLWSQSISCNGSPSPAVGSDGTVYVGSPSTTYIRAYSTSGTLTRTYNLEARLASSIAIGSDGSLYFGCDNGKFYSYASGGTLKWKYDIGVSTEKITSTPAIASDGTIYFGCSTGVYALSSSGTKKWKFPSTSVSFNTSPAITSGGNIIAGSTSGTVYSITSTGTQSWLRQLGGAVTSVGIASSGLVYVGCNNGYLYALNGSTGVIIWQQYTGGPVYSSPAVGSDDSIYVGSTSGNLYAFSSDGTQRWEYNIGSPIYSSPAIGPGGCLVVGADNGTIYCFGADDTPPGQPTVTDDGNYTAYTDRIHASWSASDPDSGIAAYKYCIGTAPGDTSVLDWTSVGSLTSVTKTGLALQDKEIYYVTVIAINGAGIEGPPAGSDGIIVDASVPSTPVVIDDGKYTSDNLSLHASWSSSDPESGIAGYEYSIGTSSGGTQVLAWTSAGLSLSMTNGFAIESPLTNGTKYYINVRAKNGGGGLSAVGSSDGITVDTTEPNQPMVTDDGDYIYSATSIHAKWSCNDAESGITKYEYSVGTSPGIADKKSWANAGTSTEATITGLSLSNGATYYVNVRAYNGIGAVSTIGYSDGAILDTTKPTTPVVTDDGAYTASTIGLHASWSASDPESGIKSYKIAIGTTTGGTDIMGWTEMGTVTSIDLAEITLEDKQTYYFSVIAVNGAGAESTPGNSDGIIVDLTPPATPVVTDDGEYTTDHGQLHASWTSSDPESGIKKYEYSIGLSAGAADVVDWTDAGTATSVTHTGLTLVDNTKYYINVRAYNNLDEVSEIGSSDGISIDSVPPPAPTVTDDGAYTSATDTLHATWTTVTSPSGIGYYEYSIGTTSGAVDVKDWTNAALTTEATETGLSLESGKTYYINVRARNTGGKAGLIGSSDGILVDISAPSRPTVTDSGAYASSATQLTANWSSSDAESGITLYEYAVGTSSGGTNIKGWTSAGTQTSATITGLSLTDGTNYYISVRATNGAKLVSSVGSSDGIIVDLSAPAKPTVTDDGAYSTSSTQLHAAWTSSDAQSGIVKYEYSIGTSAGATNTLAWTDAGTQTQKTITGLSLQSGTRYYVNIRATNGAGMLSQVGSSDGILVDTTAPTTPAVTDDGKYTRNTTTIHATWTSTDSETGITGFEYSIGTSVGVQNIVSWTNIGTAMSINRTDLSLVNGTTYYVNVRATNAAGLISTVGSSDGITVDTTPPGVPTVTDDGVYTANTSQLHVKVSCTDTESGISSYEVAVGTTAHGTDIVGWKSAGAGPDLTVTSLSLQTGITYYISARATNGAGIGGDAGTSDGIKVDTTAPTGVTVWDDGDFTGSAASLHGTWTAIDPESGIAGYKYCIGTAPGQNNIAGWLDVGTATEHTRTGLSLTTGQTYYITIIATNGAGGSSAAVSSDGIKVDLTAPTTPVVTDTGTYWGYKTSLKADWFSSDPESGITDYQFSIGTSAGTTDVADWISVGNVTTYTRTGILLSDGIKYFVNIRAKNGGGTWSAVGSSDGVMIDSTPPTTPTVTDDGDTTSVLDSLHAIWSSSDPESGIAEYLYCIGTSPGATDVCGWTSVGTNTDVTVTGLTLDPVLRYYFSVKSCSGAGAWSATGASDGIGYTSGAAIWWRFRNDSKGTGRGLFNATRTNDLVWSIPTAGMVESSPAIAADGTTYIGSGDGNIYAVTQNGTLRWTCNVNSPVSSSPVIADDGRICVGTDGGRVYCLNANGTIAWAYPAEIDSALAQPVHSSPLIRDKVVYAGGNDGNIYAIDLDTGLLNWSRSTGNALTSSPAVDSNGNIYIGSDDGCLYAYTLDGVKKWGFRTGSSIIASPSIDADGTIYIGSGDGGFYAVNPDGTGKWRFEAQLVVDSSAAIASDGTIYFGVGYDGGDGRFYALNPNGTEKWRVTLPLGGVMSSPAVDPSGMVYVGSSDKNIYAFNSDGTICWSYKTGDSVASSPALGADGSVVFGSYDGSIYCLRDVTSKDLTPPTMPVVTVPSSVLLQGEALQASWTSTDPESMVAEYTYAIGTAAGGSDIAGWTSAGIETSVTRDDIQLTVGQTYYFSVKARNPSQRWSETGVSVGVTVITEASIESIGELKDLDDGSSISLTNKVVTAVFDDCFFIEESNRCSGIRCIEAGAQLSSGSMVDVQGTLGTINGERVIYDASHTVPDPAPALSPLDSLGIPARMMLTGLNAIGLKVTVWGKVAVVGDGYFVIDDGSNLTSARGVPGLEVRCDGAPVTAGKYVAVTGVLCREQVSGQSVTVLRSLTNGSIVTYD